MCCRYVLKHEHATSLLEKLGILLATGGTLPKTRYNIAPGGRIPAIRAANESSHPHPTSGNLLGYPLPGSSSGPELTFLHWGLTPSWARDAARPVVNARAESLAEKPAFRDALRSRRCLIPASGFYEWQAIGRTRQPWLFTLRDEQPFAFAGLWDAWLAPDGTAHESCAVVTTAPNSLMTPIHHRMPALLTEAAAWDAWLDPRITRVDTLAPLLQPFPAEAMTAMAVSSQVNNTRYDDAGCLNPLAKAEGEPPDGAQFQLDF